MNIVKQKPEDKCSICSISGIAEQLTGFRKKHLWNEDKKMYEVGEVVYFCDPCFLAKLIGPYES